MPSKKFQSENDVTCQNFQNDGRCWEMYDSVSRKKGDLDYNDESKDDPLKKVRRELSQFNMINHQKVKYFAHEVDICHNPHIFSNWDSHITRQLG
jgi:hypothetical protein